ncbi:hypothetical protein OO006_01855 [Prosthecochloris sp. SCSIO W1101]|uniref:hypothetical protein n=1 Tax=Prosthecochloris sp. SCSIO W1101 TaxID=2992242 RepID=UPI00223E0518|nr:hypothetical protein [Prosthecochloris sp. SCSIO W1101]UZJ41771.1 hypothetical protein OO006_01855 [Prosthecochloris sp. SCSIO W1101]
MQHLIHPKSRRTRCSISSPQSHAALDAASIVAFRIKMDPRVKPEDDVKREGQASTLTDIRISHGCGISSTLSHAALDAASMGFQDKDGSPGQARG